MTHHTDAERADFEAWRIAEIREKLPDPGGSDEEIRNWFLRYSTKNQFYLSHQEQVRYEAWQAARRAPAAPSAWKDNDTAKLVNDLRDCAVQYHATAQLRERIAHLVRPLAARLACAPAAPVPQCEPVGSVYTMEALVPGGREVHHVSLHMPLPAGTKLYAAPQPPEAAPVELPEYGIDTANHAGIRVRGYTEQQVRDLLAAHGIGKDKA